MAIWEYERLEVKDVKDLREKDLDSLGEEGWELVLLTNVGRAGGYTFFKREKR